MDENSIAREVIGAAIEVHRALGPGLLESVYRRCLVHELERRGLGYEEEVPLGVVYKGLVIEQAYRADVLVGHRLLLELKSVERLDAVHAAQLLTYLYLKMTRKKLGLLLNFNVTVMRDGIRRIVNGL